jgi:hypothetical protein
MRCRLEDGIQVNGGDAQVEQVIEFLDDAAQIAALEVVNGGRRAPGLDVDRVVGWVAVGEAVGENLVEDGVLYPVRDSHGVSGEMVSITVSNFTTRIACLMLFALQS